MPSSPQFEYLSSRLLSRQIKYAMHKLHREITLNVLEELERCFRSRTKDSWGISFCTLLIVFLCIEGLQTFADVMVVCEIKERGEELSEYTRKESFKACEELDEYPFRQSAKLFHEIYRCYKEGRTDKSFNPLRMAGEGNGIGVDEITEGMVKSAYDLVDSHCKFYSLLKLEKIY